VRVAEEMTTDEILKAYPDLEANDVHDALSFVAEAVREREGCCAAWKPGVDCRRPQQGAVVAIEPNRIRLRALPIIPTN
jgi:Protein of unknown function (DUF433)